MIWTIPKCYDSHVHLMATGMMQSGLSLFHLKNPEEIKNLKIEKHHFRGEWLVGFGWDQENWTDKNFPTSLELDRVFSDFPVAFVRKDGHAVWLNSIAIKIVGLPTFPTGVFLDLEKSKVDQAIPPYSDEQIHEFLKSGIRYFNSNGFTHIRDMTTTFNEWSVLSEMDRSNKLTLYVESNFMCDKFADFERTLNEIQDAKKTETKHLRCLGIKVFYDGALGSEGALLSEPYIPSGLSGESLWKICDLQELVKRSWQLGVEVSVHVIGDQAAHEVVKSIVEIKNEFKLVGRLNLEHCEILRPETILLLKELDVCCYMQPCHWLSDKQWLSDKIPKLLPWVFPWAQIQKAGIQIFWGSDSPVEPASVWANYQALEQSVHSGVPRLQGDFLEPHTHTLKSWGDNCLSIFENGKPVSVVFDGIELMK